MSKITLLTFLILLYPLLRIRWRKLFDSSPFAAYIKAKMLRPTMQYVAQLKERFSEKKYSPFMALFLKHFHVKKGAFKDKALRAKVYDQLHARLEQGTNYKSLYRVAANHLHPDRARTSTLSEEELNDAFKYFQTHFKHPDNF